MSFLDRFTRNNRKELNIIIAGCGKVGTTLIKRLSEEGHNVTFSIISDT